jgi:hypothetical protein
MARCHSNPLTHAQVQAIQIKLNEMLLCGNFAEGFDGNSRDAGYGELEIATGHSQIVAGGLISRYERNNQAQPGDKGP